MTDFQVVVTCSAILLAVIVFSAVFVVWYDRRSTNFLSSQMRAAFIQSDRRLHEARIEGQKILSAIQLQNAQIFERVDRPTEEEKS